MGLTAFRGTESTWLRHRGATGVSDGIDVVAAGSAQVLKEPELRRFLAFQSCDNRTTWKDAQLFH